MSSEKRVTQSLKTIALVLIATSTWGALGMALVISLWNPLTDALGIGDWSEDAQLVAQTALLTLWMVIVVVPLIKREQRLYEQEMRASQPERFSVKDSGDSGSHR